MSYGLNFTFRLNLTKTYIMSYIKKDLLAYKMDFNQRILKPLFKYVGEYVTISDEAVEDSQLPSNRGILIDLFYEQDGYTGIISQDHYEYARISFPGKGENVVGVHELVENYNAKKMAINASLVQLFVRVGIDMPNNFDEIRDFIYEDVCVTADPNRWHDGDVAIAFRRWIEKGLNL
jgi:hypothetical protein